MLIFLFFLAIPNQVFCEIGSSSDLNCHFGGECQWRNSTEDTGDWLLADKIIIDANREIIPMRENDGMFAYTAGLMGRTMALMVSDVINCQLGGATLKYWYYKTGIESQLEICIRQPPGNKELTSMRCYDGISSTPAQQWIFRVIELPPISQPFELVFRSYYYPPIDIIAIDDITYEAALCETANVGANEGAGGGFDDDVENTFHGMQQSEVLNSATSLVNVEDSDILLNNDVVEPSNPLSISASDHRPLNFAAPILEASQRTSSASVARIGPLFVSKCSAIDCSFDEGNMCNYLTSRSNGTAETTREWKLSSKGVLNSITGIPSDLTKFGYFAYASGEAGIYSKDAFILSTKVPFDIQEDGRLDFFVYQAGIRGRLRVCFDTLTHCPLTLEGNNIGLDSRRWKNYFLDIKTGSNAIHFVADNLFENYAIGLDNIQLLNRYGSASKSC